MGKIHLLGQYGEARNPKAGIRDIDMDAACGQLAGQVRDGRRCIPLAVRL